MTTTSQSSAVLNAVLDRCSEIADYERCFEAAMARLELEDDGCHQIARDMCVPVRHGHRIWVSAAMGELCKAAASTYPTDFTLHPDDLPWPAGTVVFETPLLTVSEGFVHEGEPEGPIDAIQWVPVINQGSGGTAVVFWQSRHFSEPTNLKLA
jgi:hypothetical protein